MAPRRIEAAPIIFLIAYASCCMAADRPVGEERNLRKPAPRAERGPEELPPLPTPDDEQARLFHERFSENLKKTQALHKDIQDLMLDRLLASDEEEKAALEAAIRAKVEEAFDLTTARRQMAIDESARRLEEARRRLEKAKAQMENRVAKREQYITAFLQKVFAVPPEAPVGEEPTAEKTKPRNKVAPANVP
ncbi:MAG: hypothetical protein V1918_06675 [Planctomycetota bacterium]